MTTNLNKDGIGAIDHGSTAINPSTSIEGEKLFIPTSGTEVEVGWQNAAKNSSANVDREISDQISG